MSAALSAAANGRAPVERVVVVLGPASRRLEDTLTTIGLAPVLHTGNATVWAPPPPPAPAVVPAALPPHSDGGAEVLLTIDQAARRSRHRTQLPRKTWCSSAEIP